MSGSDVPLRTRRDGGGSGLERSLPMSIGVSPTKGLVGLQPTPDVEGLSQPVGSARLGRPAPVGQINSLPLPVLVQGGVTQGGVALQGSGVLQNVVASEYEFLQCTGDFKPADVASRKLIRSHVMRNYFQEKRNQANVLSSATSASTVSAKNKLKGRWRLEPSHAKESKRLDESSGQRRDSAVSRGGSKTTATASRKTSRGEDVEESVELLNPLNTYEVQRSESYELVSQRVVLEQFEASPWDPFNALPVKTGGRVDRLLTFCKFTAHRDPPCLFEHTPFPQAQSIPISRSYC